MGQESEIRVIPAAKRDPRVTKVGIYARVSTARAEQLRSLAAQVSTLTRHVYKRYDWILKDTYIDVGSAKTGSSRREFTRMIEDCKAGELDYILIKSPSRLGRDSVEVIDAVREILDSGAKLYFEEGLTAREISERSKEPLKTVQSHIYRAREMLKKKIRKEDLLT